MPKPPSPVETQPLGNRPIWPADLLILERIVYRLAELYQRLVVERMAARHEYAVQSFLRVYPEMGRVVAAHAIAAVGGVRALDL